MSDSLEVPPPIVVDTILIPMVKAQGIGVCGKLPQIRALTVNGRGRLYLSWISGDLVQYGAEAFIVASMSDTNVIAGRVHLQPWMEIPEKRRLVREPRVIHIGEEPKRRGFRLSTRCAQCGKDILNAET